MGIALAEADSMKIELPGLELAKKLFDQLNAQGYGRSGTQALFKYYDRQGAA